MEWIVAVNYLNSRKALTDSQFVPVLRHFFCDRRVVVYEEKRLSAARDREQAITEELSKEERHADEIELWQNKLRELDAKLGVDEK